MGLHYSCISILCYRDLHCPREKSEKSGDFVIVTRAVSRRGSILTASRTFTHSLLKFLFSSSGAGCDLAFRTSSQETPAQLDLSTLSSNGSRTHCCLIFHKGFLLPKLSHCLCEKAAQSMFQLHGNACIMPPKMTSARTFLCKDRKLSQLNILTKVFKR